MKIGIGFRTMKTALGVCVSIWIAQSLGLDYFTAAGILTLLCIQKSRKQSYSAAVSRAIACVSGMFYAAVLFHLLGYHPYTFLVLLMTFIPFCVRLGVQEGIASSIVVVMHVYMHGFVDNDFILNELFVVTIGLGVALIINWYMPSIDKEIEGYRRETDRLTSRILHEIAVYLKDNDAVWNGKEVLELADTLRKGKRMAALDAENSRRRKKEISYSDYFEHKQRQYDLLERMLPFISRMHTTIEQGRRLGEFVELLSQNLNNRSEASRLHDMLCGIREYHKLLPLPETREAFENRANLFAFANELQRFVETIRSGPGVYAEEPAVRLKKRAADGR